MMVYIIMFISCLLVGLVYIIFLMLNIKKTLDLEEISPYECGFDPSSSTRINFSYRFFLVAILFIVFDVEISLLLPVPFIIKSEFGLWIFIMFMMILIVGLMYEYFCGSLDWMETVILY